MVHGAGVGRCPGRVGHALLVREHRDEPPVAGVEVEVALGLVVEVGLVEDERHAEHALPEVDRRLPVGADDRDVVHALALDLAHGGHRPSVVVVGAERCSAVLSASHWTAAGMCAGSMWCAASDSWYSTGKPPACSSAPARRAKSTFMIGSRRPWAMNTGRSGREARSGCQPSTVGMNPEKARSPAGAGRSPARPSA